VSTTRIDDTQAANALRSVQVLARQQWATDRQVTALEEYEDAGMAAIAGCLAHYDPQRGIQFDTYAEHRIRGAMHDTACTYERWHQGRYWRKAKPRVELLRPSGGPQPDPVLRARLVREVPTLSPCDGALLVRLLAGEELDGIAETDGMLYITVYKRYRHLLRTLRQRLRQGP
jgi:hypothetical protein